MKTTRPVLLIDYEVTFALPKYETVNFCGVFPDVEYFHKFASSRYNFSSSPVGHKICKMTKGTADFVDGIYENFTVDKSL
jgi:hypothetical protein